MHGAQVFSAGCVAAELFLDGEPLLALSDLLAYRRGGWDPGEKLALIADASVRDMTTCMVSLEPGLRQSAAFHLRAWEGNKSVFPVHLASFLHPFAWESVGLSSPDKCIAAIAESKERILAELGFRAEEDSLCPALVNVMVMVTACMRSVQSPVAKVQAVRLIGWGAGLLDDHVRMHRLLPYLAALISDEHEASSVRAASIAEAAALLERVRTFPASERQVFLQYLLPVLSSAAADAEEHAAVAYAKHLGSLARTALRFLEESHAAADAHRGAAGARDGGTAAGAGAPEAGYDAELAALQEVFVSLASDMLSSASGVVKRMVLTDMLPLCVLLGGEKTDNSLLPLIITVLNDRSDWELRAAFFDNLAAVATFVGRDSLQHFILPCIVQALTDLHELVVEAALSALAALVELSLLPSDAALRAAQGCLPLLLHPSGALRLGTLGFLAALADFLGLADAHCLLRPLLLPYLRRDAHAASVSFSAETLGHALRTPLPRAAFRAAMQRACACLEQGEAPSLERLRAAARAEEGVGRGGQSGAGREEEEGGADKLELLHGHVVAVAQAQVAQALSDAQLVQDTRQEEAARASEEWLQEEWDAFFGQSLAAPLPREPPLDPRHSAAQRAPPASGAALRPAAAERLGSAERRVAGATTAGGLVGAEGAGGAAAAAGGARLGEVDVQAARWVATVEGRERSAGVDAAARAAAAEWRPRGVLVANLTEHKHAVSALCVPDDHTFFASGGEDGTVKIWDAAGLDARSEVAARLTLRAPPGRITALAMCRSSTALAVAQDSGAVTLVRVDAPLASSTQNQSGQWPQRAFTGTTTLRALDYAGEQGVQALAHVARGNSSLLMVATQRGCVHAHDLAQEGAAFSLQIPPACGVPLCLAAGLDRHWLLVGTSRGFHVLYDLRFQARPRPRRPAAAPPAAPGSLSARGAREQLDVQCWRHPGASEVYALAPCNAAPLQQALGGARGGGGAGGPWVASAAGRNQVSVWDVSRGACVAHLAATSSAHVADVGAVDVHASAALAAERDPCSADFGLKELQSLRCPAPPALRPAPALQCAAAPGGRG